MDAEIRQQGRRDRAERQPPKFVRGSLLRHILVMMSTSAVGISAMYIGDLASIYFLSLLEDQSIVAAMSYASPLVVLMLFIGVGLGIATTALVSPALGAGRFVRARRLCANALLWAFVVACVLSVFLWVLVPSALGLLGAEGRTLNLASDYLRLMIIAFPAIAVGVAATAVLRSAGDARRAMTVMLVGAGINILLDPLFIFSFELGIQGAAIAAVIARFIVVGVCLYFVVRVHNLLGRPKLRSWLSDARPLAIVALPAIATNIATPVANAYTTSVISEFGEGAVAGWGIIGRIIPIAFAAVFALSAAVGPIIGQNYGAHNYDRMRKTLRLSLLVTAGFTVFAWFVLAMGADVIVRQFRATGEAADLIKFFCQWLSPLFVFSGALFVSNAIFNTLGRPHIATALNWTRTTIGTVPFVLVGAHYLGAQGVLMGYMVGSIFIGAVAAILCERYLARIQQQGSSAV